MAIESTSVTIEQTEYTISQMPGKLASHVWVRILPYLGEFFAGAGEGTGSVKELMSKETGIADGLRSVTSRLRWEDYDWLADCLLKHVTFKNKNGTEVTVGVVRDAHFKGKVSLELRLIVEALKVNYADFLDGKYLKELFTALG